MATDASSRPQVLPPVAVRTVDIDSEHDLDLVRDGAPYRAAMIIATRAGRPRAVATFPLDGETRLSAGTLRERFADVPAGGDWAAGAQAAATPSVSVVVTTCAQPDSVAAAVASVLACDPPALEVVVVENRPTDSPVPQRLREQFGAEPRVRYVEEHHRGLSAARNAGLHAAVGEAVVFTDDDVVVDPAWVGALAAAFASEPEAVCVTGLILPHDLETESQVEIEQFAGFGKGFERRAFRASAPTSPLFPFAAGEFGSGACTALRRDFALAIGGFDTALGAGTVARGGEDLDLFVRILLAGELLVYEPAAMIWHRHPADAEHVRLELYSYGVGLSAMLTKQMLSGHALAVLRRIPRALWFLVDPSSRKNVRKGPEYPRSYDWLERRGMLAGPVAYLRSRRHERRLERARTVAA